MKSRLVSFFKCLGFKLDPKPHFSLMHRYEFLVYGISGRNESATVRYYMDATCYESYAQFFKRF